MTSFALISHVTRGVLPLAIAQGPGSELRQVLGTAVFTGMLGVTVFGLFLTPVFYVLLRGLSQRFWRGEHKQYDHQRSKTLSSNEDARVAASELVAVGAQLVS